jgi:hypothetical protein
MWQSGAEKGKEGNKGLEVKKRSNLKGWQAEEREDQE